MWRVVLLRILCVCQTGPVLWDLLSVMGFPIVMIIQMRRIVAPLLVSDLATWGSRCAGSDDHFDLCLVVYRFINDQSMTFPILNCLMTPVQHLISYKPIEWCLLEHCSRLLTVDMEIFGHWNCAECFFSVFKL